MDRVPDSVRFRETNAGFKSESVYDIVINMPGYPEPFTSKATGLFLNMGNPNTERQANYPFGLIGQLPIYYELESSSPPPNP